MQRGRSAVWLCVGVACAVQAGLLSLGTDEGLAISRLILVESRAAGQNLVDETYRAELAHSGAAGSGDVGGVTAAIVSWTGLEAPGVLQIVDGALEFGSVRAGATVESRDTVTIRRLVNVPPKLQQLKWKISARSDLVLPAAWSGTWRFTITTRDSLTNQAVAVDEITDSIGAAEAAGFAQLPPFVACRWTASDAVLDAACRMRVKTGECRVDGVSHFTVQRDGATLAGGGDWQTTTTGDCGRANGTSGGSMAIGAVRLSDAVDSGQFSPGALTKLVTSPTLSTLLGGGGQR